MFPRTDTADRTVPSRLSRGCALAAAAALSAAGLASGASVTFLGSIGGAGNKHHRVDDNNPAQLEPAPNADQCPYVAMEFVVDVTGIYTFPCSQGGYDGMIVLYSDAFSPLSPVEGVVAANNDSPSPGASNISAKLFAGRRYVLVNTTVYNWGAGSFTQTIQGPGTIALGPSCSVRDQAKITASSPAFLRPAANGDVAPVSAAAGAPTYRYVARRLTVDVGGRYAVSSRGNIDGFLALYAGPFNPASPLTNCVVANDDLAGSWPQSGFMRDLLPGTVYTLVATTFAPGDTGTLEVTVTGPGRIETERTCGADYNMNGQADLLDIFAFLEDWFAGCP